MNKNEYFYLDLCYIKYQIEIKGGLTMKRYTLRTVAHCSEGCQILSWA